MKDNPGYSITTGVTSNPGYNITTDVTSHPNYSITTGSTSNPDYTITTSDDTSGGNWIYIEGDGDKHPFQDGPDVHMEPDPDPLIAKGTIARILDIRRPEKSLAPKEEMGEPTEKHR